MEFRLAADYEPKGDQPEAIEAITESIRAGKPSQTLLGVTGSGKTFTMAISKILYLAIFIFIPLNQ